MRATLPMWSNTFYYYNCLSKSVKNPSRITCLTRMAGVACTHWPVMRPKKPVKPAVVLPNFLSMWLNIQRIKSRQPCRLILMISALLNSFMTNMCIQVHLGLSRITWKNKKKPILISISVPMHLNGKPMNMMR